MVSFVCKGSLLSGYCQAEPTLSGSSSSPSPSSSSSSSRPLAAVGTWNFGSIAVTHASKALIEGRSAVEAVVAGVRAVELDERGQYFVGVGGLPNAKGDMELDAAVMDHSRRYGAVMGIREVKTPIEVARWVMERSVHNVFVGEGALEVALEMGMKRQPDVLTVQAKEEWRRWKEGNDEVAPMAHDTIGLICLDGEGRLACGVSTSGWKFKQAGRVGDAPLIGCGLYCDGKYGAAVATGDGEEALYAH